MPTVSLYRIEIAASKSKKSPWVFAETTLYIDKLFVEYNYWSGACQPQNQVTASSIVAVGE